MTKEQVKEILNRVLTWLPERQADIAHVAELMEEQDSSSHHLTDEQLAEVRRRRAEINPRTLTLDEWDKRLRRFGTQLRSGADQARCGPLTRRLRRRPLPIWEK